MIDNCPVLVCCSVDDVKVINVVIFCSFFVCQKASALCDSAAGAMMSRKQIAFDSSPVPERIKCKPACCCSINDS